MTARRPLVAGIAIAVGLTVAACGSSSNSSVAAVRPGPASTGGGASTTTPDRAPDRQAIQQCLAQKGLSLPQGGFRGGGPPASGSAGTAPAGSANPAQPPTSRPPLDPQLQQALRDCGAGAGFGRGGGAGGAGFNDPALRQCLADHGVTLPQPGAGTAAGTASSAPPSSASANLRQAMQACRAQLAPTTSPPATG